MCVSESTGDGGQPNESHAVYQILSQYSKKSSFLQNVGIMHKPLQSRVSKPTAHAKHGGPVPGGA